MRARQQLVVEQPLLVDALEHRLARAVERQPGELGVQVVGRLRAGRRRRAARRCRSTFCITWPPRATMTTSTRVALSGTNSTRSKTAASCAGRDGEADVARGLRQHVRDLRQHVVEQRTGGRRAAAAPRRRWPSRVERLRLEQQVHVEAVAAVGRDAPGRGVRLLDEPFSSSRARMLRTVADDTPSPAAVDEQRRGDRLARLDVLADERGEDAARPVVELRASWWSARPLGS